MEATTNIRKRKPLADRTNTTSFSYSSNSITTRSHHKLPPNPPFPTPNSTSTAAAAAHPVSSKSSNQTEENKKQQLFATSSIETRNRKRRKLADTTTAAPRSVDKDANKENVPVDVNHTDTNTNFDDDDDIHILPDISSPSTPSVRQPLSPLAEPLTVYARRQTAKKKGKEKVVTEAFTCPPVERKRNKSNKESVAKISECLTELPKKRRNKEHVVSSDYLEQQRAYFAEIDKCELPEEEISESELPDH